MILTGLWLANFRSHTNTIVEFSPDINLILGKNGAGKTNILEAIQLLSTGKTFLSHSLSELIKWDSSFSTIQGKLDTDSSVKLEVQLYKKEGSAAISRNFKLDQVSKSRAKYSGTLKTVVFQPDDLRLITGSPSRRRDFLDDILSSLHWQYDSARTGFNKALKQRNQLLDLIFLGKATQDQLVFWDTELVKNAKIIGNYRNIFLNESNANFKASKHSEIQAIYIDYRQSQVTQELLKQSYQIDLRRGSTSIGPHRDDYIFHSAIFKNPNTSIESWASRGQERLAILAFKLAQIAYIKSNFNQSPILLLDDIFSELDPEHRDLVVNICSSHQSFITSAEPGVESLLPGSNLIQL